MKWGVWAGAVDHAPLRVLGLEHASWSGCGVEARILATSHALTIVRGTDRATELLTCATFPEGALAQLAEVGSARVDVGPWSWSVELRLGGLDELPEGPWRMESDFPGHPASRTVLALDPEAPVLRLRSYHAYPEDGAALIGTSEVRWR
ncbi:MAG: DUF2617 family protein [Armatimonadota bacterium]